MRTTSRRTHGLVAALALAVLATPGTAQEDSGPSLPWPAIQAGVRFGYDDGSNGTVAGAQMRIPVIRAGWIELVPAGDVTFLTGLKEYQFTGDVALLSGGRRGGLYAAVGFAARNSIYEGPGRETRTGTTVALGLSSRGFGDVPIGTQIEVRWIFIDAPFDPRTITFGVNLPLWGRGERGRR
ncbi:MAG: hypothetical protein RH859_12935 [Longimicrobiales bacterium]